MAPPLERASINDKDFLRLIYDRFAATIRSWSNVGDIYAISFYIYDEEDDPKKPTVTLGFNTEANLKALRPKDRAEARWNFAFWPQTPQSEIGTFNSDTEADRDDWVFALPNYRHPTTEFAGLCVRVARRLHQAGVIKESLGRSVPIIVHELEYYDRIAQQTAAANPGGITDAFVDWVYRLYD